MKISSRLIALIVSYLLLGGIGCEPQPTPQETPSEPPPVVDRGENGLGTIGDRDEKVNDLNGLGESGDVGDSEEVERECPPPQASEDMCAQVIVWARSPEGICCEYPTPCHAPEGWETFGTEEACVESNK